MKKVLSILLTIIMLFTMVPANVFAADTSVKLVSFMRGDVNDLRSSELLEVQVEGYDGNPRELTYKWTSSLGTYLYIYNSHNMYGINNTYGEMEIYNTSKNVSRSGNVEEDRAGNKTLTKEGFMWASVYGAYTYNGGSSTALQGTVTVEVFDKNGNSLGSDSFSSFKAFNLANDIDNVVIGLFEGDRVNVLDLLGQSGIVHITCDESKVSSATILSGKDHIALETEKKGNNNYNYFIKGLKAGDNSTNGDAEISIEIKKEVCKFHYKSSGKASPIVYVFKKPKTSTTTTTLTLVDDIDSRCEYFINGNKGEEQDDGTIIFTGLDPNTTYTVEVRAEYNDNGKTKYVYGYVEDTTKPVYKATVKTYLDGTITDISDIHGADVDLLLVEKSIADKANVTTEDIAENSIELIENGEGTYEATVENGTYYPYHRENGTYHIARTYKLIVQNANTELHLHHYSVKYDTNGGAFENGAKTATEIYSSMTAVNATENIPVRDGYVFAGWEYNGKVIGSGAEVTSSITAPITLKAKWEKEVNVTINVTIDHEFNIDGGVGVDPNPDRTDLVVNFLEMKEGTPAFIETGDKLHFTEDKVTDENGNAKAYNYELVDEHISKFTSNGYTYTGLLETSAFGVALSKTGYDVESVTKTQDDEGNWLIDIKLVCKPDDFDVDFSVEMEKDVPKELYPDAVIVKVAYWNEDLKEWKIISQQETTDAVTKPGVRVDIDPETGKGFGSYPVWMYDSEGKVYGYRAVVTGFIYDGSTIIVPTEKKHTKDDNTVVVTYTDGNYTATMGDIADGKKFSTSLNGAYYNDETKDQQGTLHGVISVEKYDVIFDAQGGTNAEGKDAAKQVYRVPKLDGYKPTMENHDFLGWYKDKECTIPAVENELLTADITLYAKWDKILNGTLIVDGYYMIGDNKVSVNDVDRAKYALVELEEITPDGTYNIAGQTVEIVWEEGKNFSVPAAYEFKNLDPDKTYRIDVYLINYTPAYQNSTTVINGNGDIHDDYNSEDFKAVYTETSKLETFVNTFLHFEPASYFQPVEVDATLIGANSRPSDTLVEVWYKATGTDNAYQVISQHTVVPYGIEIGMNADGTDDAYYGYLVWNSTFNGNLYDYQANLTKLTKKVGENKVTTALADWPVSVVYGEPSRYSPLNNAATGTLQVKLVPNRYAVIYNENYAVNDEKVVSYDTHIWSYETAVTYVPVREGYIFQGWYSNPEFTGEKVTAISETVAEDTNLYAKWEAETGYELTVNYVEKLTGTVLETEIKEYSFDDVVTAESLKKDFKGFTYDSASPESVKITKDRNEITLYYVRNDYEYKVNYLEEGTEKVLATSKIAKAPYASFVTEAAIAIDDYVLTGYSSQTVTITIDTDETKNVINFYYATDSLGGGNNGDESDGTPDKYQKKVIFKVVNGAWFDGTTEDIVQYLTLIKDGKFSVDGTATLTAPTGMIANNGYKNGTWDKVVPAEVSDTETLVFTYSFDRSTTPVNPLDSVRYVVEHYKENANGTYDLVEDDTLILEGKVGETVTATVNTYENYCLNENISELNGIITAINAEGGVLTLKLYYDIDKLGDGENGDESDGTPDKYQKKVIFKVVNGTWADGSVADKVEYLDLMKAGKFAADGTATLTAPTGMIAFEGFEGGSWDVTPPAEVSGTNVEVYTYTFKEYVPEVPDEPETPDNPDTPVDPDTPDNPNGDGTGTGDGNGSLGGNAQHILFGKTDGIGWYQVSQDGGQTWDIVFGNSTYEVKHGTEIIVKAGDLMGDSFTFYVNGDAVKPDENGCLVITVNSYMLIGAIGIDPDIDFEVPDVEESLNWFQKIIKAIKDFFAKLFGKN